MMTSVAIVDVGLLASDAVGRREQLITVAMAEGFAALVIRQTLGSLRTALPIGRVAARLVRGK